MGRQDDRKFKWQIVKPGRNGCLWIRTISTRLAWICHLEAGSSPSTELAHARTVLLVMLVHMPIRLSLFWHSVMEVSLPSQSTAASATGRFSNSTCTPGMMRPQAKI